MSTIERSSLKAARGYISSRPIMGDRVPQRVQNIVIKEYCTRVKLDYLLSATEMAQRSSYRMLMSLVESPEHRFSHLAFYSIGQLPISHEQRRDVLMRIFEQGRKVFCCVEDITLSDESDIEEVDNFFAIRSLEVDADLLRSLKL